MEELRQRILERVDSLRDDGVALLEELVRIDSTNPSFAGVDRAAVIGGETRCNEVLRERYEQAGLETHWVAPDPERKNLVGVRSGSGGGRSLILNGHVDVVPAGDVSVVYRELGQGQCQLELGPAPPT